VPGSEGVSCFVFRCFDTLPVAVEGTVECNVRKTEVKSVEDIAGGAVHY
jgi:hypothetical protein